MISVKDVTFKTSNMQNENQEEQPTSQSGQPEKEFGQKKSKCPECLEPTDPDELACFGGFCEYCSEHAN